MKIIYESSPVGYDLDGSYSAIQIIELDYDSGEIDWLNEMEDLREENYEKYYEEMCYTFGLPSRHGCITPGARWEVYDFILLSGFIIINEISRLNI